MDLDNLGCTRHSSSDHEVLATERDPEGLGEMMKRVLHAVQLAVPIGIITRPNIAQRSNLGSALVGTRFG